MVIVIDIDTACFTVEEGPDLGQYSLKKEASLRSHCIKGRSFEPGQQILRSMQQMTEARTDHKNDPTMYGFNCGSTLSISSAPAREIVAISALNTTIAPVVCSLTSMALELAYHGKVLSVYQLFVMSTDFDQDQDSVNCPNKEPMDLHQAAINGILAGLVTITAGAATTHPHATIPVAIFGAVVYHLAYRYQYNWGIDDAVNAAPVHLWCGIWGTIAASLCYSFKFRNTYFDLMETRGYDIDHGGEEDCGRGGQLLANVIFAIVTVLWAAATSRGTFAAIEHFFPEHTKHQEQRQQATQDKIEATIMRVELRNDGNSGTPRPPTEDGTP